MKKIFSLLIISLFFVSCTDTTVENPIDEGPWVPVIQVPRVYEDSIEEVNENEQNEDKAPTEEISEDTETPIEWASDTEETNSDDEALESEVNDLLDEFIDSLDSYDK